MQTLSQRSTTTSGKSAAELGTLISEASALLASKPGLAKLRAERILKAVPDHPFALLMLGTALHRTGDPAAAIAVLEALVKHHSSWPEAFLELGTALGQAGQRFRAIGAFTKAVALTPDIPQAWRAIGDEELASAADALGDNSLDRASHILETRLARQPADPGALHLMALVHSRRGDHEKAEPLLRHALESAPASAGLRFSLAIALYGQQRAADALAEAERLIAEEPAHVGGRDLQGLILSESGRLDEAMACYQGILAERPDLPKMWLAYGHALRTAGRIDESIAAYRRSVELLPGHGAAYWSLANLKTMRFSTAEMAAMRTALRRPELANDARSQIHYSLGKALEDARSYEESFKHYQAGAQLQRRLLNYRPDETSRWAARTKAFFTRELFETRSGQGDPAPDPIFVVGLPRSGSTLVEQILASHSRVEGTMELVELSKIAKSLGPNKDSLVYGGYPEKLGELSADELRSLGTRYLAGTAQYRLAGRPYFIDKMPSNFLFVGLVQLILPNAKIIDTRRDAMSSCFSAFKQLFARGHAFSYDLDDVARYYRDYVDLMAHFDEVLPGRIHRVIYERMVDDTEAEIRALLDHCGLPFEEGCLRFNQTDRAVRTASSEQVRQPIFRSGLDQWRKYEPWLTPLKVALGPELARS